MKERKLVWLVLGTNDGYTDPAWFYVLQRLEEANAFMEHAKVIDKSITWDSSAYPCEIDSLSSALDAFKQAKAMHLADAAEAAARTPAPAQPGVTAEEEALTPQQEAYLVQHEKFHADVQQQIREVKARQAAAWAGACEGVINDQMETLWREPHVTAEEEEAWQQLEGVKK